LSLVSNCVIAALNVYINRMLTLPITKQAKQQEWKIILAVAQNSGFPLHIIHNLKKKLIAKKTKTKTSNHNNTTNQEMGNILISQSTNTKSTNLFKQSNLNIALRATKITH